MAIVAQCGSCQQRFQVRDEFAGKRFKCKSCGGVVDVPSNDLSLSDPLMGDPDPLGGFHSNQQAPMQQPMSQMQGGFPGGHPGQMQGGWGGMQQAPAKGGGFPTWAIAAIGGGVGGLLLIIGLVIWFVIGSGNDQTANAANGTSPSANNNSTGTNSTSSNSVNSNSTGTGEVTWQVTTDPSRSPVAWPNSLNLDIPFPKGTSSVLQPTGDSPFVALVGAQNCDAELWSLLTGQKAGTLPGCMITYSVKEYALSPDGKYMAVARASSGSEKVAEIWSFETGKLLKSITCDEKPMALDLVDFAGPGQLLSLSQGSMDGKYAYRFRVTDIASAKLLREFYVDRSQDKSSIAFSPGRRYLASYSNSVVHVFDLQKGGTAGKWTLENYDSTANVFASMNFSPDGKQLGFLLSGTNTNLKLIDMTTGKLTDDIMVAGISHISGAYTGEAIEWLPGGQGWCIRGATIIDAKAKRIVWNLKIDHLSHSLNARRTLPGGWITSAGPYSSFRMKFIPAPWEQIRSSVAAFNANGAARLRPGMSVSLDIEVGTLRFSPPELTKTFLADAFTKQFKSGGIDVAEGQPVVMKINYSESKGKELTFRQLGTVGGSPNDGKKLVSTRSLIKMTLQSSDGGTTYWSENLDLDPSSVVIKGDATEESIRDALLGRLPWNFASQPIPFFVPQDASIATLPGATVLENK